MPKKPQNSYICTFEHINVDQSAIAARVCDFKLFNLVTSARLGWTMNNLCPCMLFTQEYEPEGAKKGSKQLYLHTRHH